MAPPSRLAVATSSLQRLLKEELSYHKEVAQQEAHIQRLEQEPSDGDENSEFQLKQEVLLQRIASPLCQASGELIHVQRQAVQETKNIFPSVRQRILDGVTKLEQLLVRTRYLPDLQPSQLMWFAGRPAKLSCQRIRRLGGEGERCARTGQSSKVARGLLRFLIFVAFSFNWITCVLQSQVSSQ